MAKKPEKVSRCLECNGIGFRDVPCQRCGKLYVDTEELANTNHVFALVEYLDKHKPTTISVDRKVFLWLVSRARLTRVKA